jgi:hypothetical protein
MNYLLPDRQLGLTIDHQLILQHGRDIFGGVAIPMNNSIGLMMNVGGLAPYGGAFSTSHVAKGNWERATRGRTGQNMRQRNVTATAIEQPEGVLFSVHKVFRGLKHREIWHLYALNSASRPPLPNLNFSRRTNSPFLQRQAISWLRRQRISAQRGCTLRMIPHTRDRTLLTPHRAQIGRSEKVLQTHFPSIYRQALGRSWDC